MSPVKYELGFYIPEDGILYSDRHGNKKILHLLISLNRIEDAPNPFPCLPMSRLLNTTISFYYFS
jgi:hypothetical protein